MISRDIIEAIRERTDIVEVVSQVVTLQRKGASLMGLCPFHQEKSPSFSVVPHKGIYHCFGCGEGGDVFKFIEKTRGIPFADVVKELAAGAGIQIEDRELSADERKRIRARADLHEVCELAAGWFQSNLQTRPEGKLAREYLASRGMSADTLNTWRVGYAPESWDGLLNFLHSKGVPADLAVSAGLAKAREGGGRDRGAYDLFRDRILLPIEDPRGRVVAFGGRVLPGARADAPKYVNSPETPIYKKSSVLFGLRQARTAIQRKGRMLVVEGYFDVLSLHQAGFQESVATCGTALTAEHARAVRTLTRTVVALFDSDEAGERAAVRSMEVFLGVGIEPRRLTLDGAKDPDDFVQEQGAEAFEAALGKAEPLFELVLRRAMERHGTTPGGRSSVLRDLAPVVRLYPPESRDPIASRLQRALWMDPRAINEAIGQSTPTPAPGAQRPPAQWRGTVELNHLLWLVLHHPAQVAEIIAEIEPTLVTRRESALLAIAMLLEQKNLPEVMEATQDPELARILRAAAAREGLYSAEQAAPAARQILDRLLQNQIRAEISQIEQRLAACGTGDDMSRLDLLRQRQELQRSMGSLKRKGRSGPP